MKKEIPESIKIELLETRRLFNMVIEEMKSADENLFSENKLNDSFYRRIIIKNTFSIIETYIHIIKKSIKLYLTLEEPNKVSLDWTELIILNEKKVLLDNKGNTKVKDEFQKFEPNLRFTLNTFSKLFKINKPEYGNTEFQKLIVLSKRRNEITHPKKSNDLNITKEELHDLIKSFGWFIKVNEKINSSYLIWLKEKLNTE
ncbi:hypothetical protein [Galbibacter orientalis]|uniref:hypothetical protein n=1 Tax=Galbibacter orientalis TaxID=453852 RepID=UPI00307FCFB3